MAKSNFIVRGGADFSGIKKELAKTQTQLQGFQTKVSSIMKGIATAIGSLAVGKLIKDSTKVAMSVESAMDNIGRNMGNAASAFQNWVDTQSKALGMAKADAYSYGSVFSNLLSSFTSGAQETADQTQALMKAAAIIASKTGRTYEDVANRIRSGMLGSTEAIEDLGVYVNVSMLEATDAFKKFAGNKSWSQLTFQQQQQIRLSAILEQTYKRYGDTLADTTQTRQAQFLASLQNIKLTLGQAFLPIYNAVLPALTAMADAINRVVSVFAQFTQALFGKAATTQAKATQQQAAAMTELGEATEATGKKAKGALAGFDEIHQLATESGAAGGIAAPETGTPAAPGIVDEDAPSKMAEMAQKFKKAFEPATEAFERLKKAAEPVINSIGQGLKWFYDNVLQPIGSWTISKAVPTFFDLLAGALSLLNPTLKAFKTLGQWLWDKFLRPIAKWTGHAFINSMELVTNALKNLGDWLSENQEMVVAGLSGILAGILAYKAIKGIPVLITAVQAAIAGIGTAIGAITSPIGLAVTAVTALVGAFVYFYNTNKSFRGVVDGILNQIKDAALYLWENVLVPFGLFLGNNFAKSWDAVRKAAGWLWENVLIPLIKDMQWFWHEVIEPVANVLQEFLAIAFEKVSKVAESFWQNVLVPLGNFFAEIFQPTIEAISAVFTFLWDNVLKPLGENISNTFKPVIEALVNVFEFLWKHVLKPLVDFIGGTFVSVFDTVFTIIGDIINGLKDIFVGLMNFITGVFTGNWEKAWEGIKQIFEGIWNSLWGIVKGIINLIIDGLNSLIDGVNLVTGTIGDVIGVNLRIPKIPKLARGGIVTSPTLAMIGERGPEAVVPLENTGFVDAIASAVGTAVLSSMQMANTPGSGNGKEFVLNINGRQFIRAVLDDLDSELVRMGYRSIKQPA